MNHHTYMIGIDIGTTSTKAVLFGRNGEQLAIANHGYPLYTPDIATAEQDPEEIFLAVQKAIKQVMTQSAIEPSHLSFISFSSAMHSVIAMDKADQPLTHCITWADNRSAKWANKIKSDLNGHEIYRRTGTPIHPMSPLCKIAWITAERSALAKQVKKYIGIKEYIFHRLFGKYVVDHSVASATGLMNIKSLAWDIEALGVAGISADQLSELAPTTEIMTGCAAAFAKEMGILPNTRFVIGAADGVLSNLGVNAVKKGEIAVTIGTSGAIRTVISKPLTDAQERIFCYALTPDHWVIGGAVNNGGIVLRWIKESLAQMEVEEAVGVDPYEAITEIASRVKPGANGLLFHPYITGERAPLWNPNAKGSFIGLNVNHGREHMIRAALEGVIFNLYAVFLGLESVMETPVTAIKATGGFAKSTLWRQIVADVFNAQVMVPKSHEASCFGACLLGLYALGEIDSFDIVDDFVGLSHQHEPNPQHATIYQELMPIFNHLSNVLETSYESIAAYQSKEI